MTLTGNWNYPTNIRFGAGRINEIAELLALIKSARPLIVTDSGLAHSTIINHLKTQLQQANIDHGVFSDIKPNPTEQNVSEGVEQFHLERHDSVIGVGGGSGLDAAKAIALMAGQDRRLFEFEDIGDNWTKVKVDGMAPVIAVPTTAGTGSEVGRASVILDQQRQRKCIIFHPQMLPEYVIADPELTIGLPPQLTAATGIDALVHSLEAYFSPGYHPMADGIALQSIALIKQHLPVAYHHGDNIEARSHMLAAATMGATAFQKGLGGVHALAHPLGALFDKHHGLLNAILLPYVLVANRDAIGEKTQQLNRFVGLQDGSVDTLIEWLLDFRQALKIPNTLAEIGLGLNVAEQVGKMALADPCSLGNPQKLTAAQYSQIYCHAINGDLNKC